MVVVTMSVDHSNAEQRSCAFNIINIIRESLVFDQIIPLENETKFSGLNSTVPIVPIGSFCVNIARGERDLKIECLVFKDALMNFPEGVDALIGMAVLKDAKINLINKRIQINKMRFKLKTKNTNSPNSIGLLSSEQRMKFLLEKIEDEHLTELERKKLHKVIECFNDVFFIEGVDRMPGTSLIKHHINSKNDEPTYSPQFILQVSFSIT